MVYKRIVKQYILSQYDDKITVYHNDPNYLANSVD